MPCQLPRRGEAKNNNKKLILAVISSAAVVLSTVYIPALAPIFKTLPLGLRDMLITLGFSFAVPLASGVLAFFRKK